MNEQMKWLIWLMPAFFLWTIPCETGADTASRNWGIASLPDTVARIKPSIVGVGTVLKTRRPPNVLMATGFVISDGHHVLTNAHAVPEKINEKKNEFLAVFSGQGRKSRTHRAEVLAADPEHDLALLRIGGGPLPSLELGDDQKVREGEFYAFTGFPLGAVLGLYSATSRGIVSAITPIAIPANAGRNVKTTVYKRLKRPYPVFQLDATAYPGNSGSPLYDAGTGRVVGIINMVFVKGTKEHAITNPSGITYAIPVRHARNLLKTAGMGPKP